MLIGAAIFATDYAMRPDELARELEQRGYESLWLPEHTTFRQAAVRLIPLVETCRGNIGTRMIRF